MKRVGWMIVACLGVAGNAQAQVREPDALYVTGQADSGSAFSGGGGQVEWLHRLSDRSSITVGGATTTLGDLWWSAGTFSALARRDHGIFSGRVSAGPGRSGGDAISYYQFSGAASLPLGTRAFADVEAQRASLAHEATTVFKVGGTFAATKHVTLRLAHFSALSRVTNSYSIWGRGDLAVGRMLVFGGATGTSGRSSDTVLQAVDLATHASRELFIGTSVLTRRRDVTGVVQIIREPGGSLLRATATMRVPLGSGPTTVGANGR